MTFRPFSIYTGSDLLTVVLPQSLAKQPEESQELLEQVEDVIENARNDVLSLDVASRICNSDLLSRTEQLIAFAFHDSGTVIEATREYLPELLESRPRHSRASVEKPGGAVLAHSRRGKQPSEWTGGAGETWSDVVWSCRRLA